MMIRSRSKLEASAMQRFPDDADQRRDYIDLVLAASESHTATTYTITAEAFAEIKAAMLAKYGPRPKLSPTQPDPETRFVGLTVALKRLGKGAIGLTKNALHLDQAEKDMRIARLLICEKCPESTPIEKAVESRSCGKLMKSNGKTCGCGLDAKTRIASERCPQHRW